MMLPDRISAIILKEGKLLLVSSEDFEMFWTPGGKIECNESHRSALKRELKEELSLDLVSMKKYFSYKTINDKEKKRQNVHCYIVKVKGKIHPSAEITKFMWYSKHNFKKKTPKTTKGMTINVLPRLIKDVLLK